jgi:hypothetical protein
MFAPALQTSIRRNGKGVPIIESLLSCLFLLIVVVIAWYIVKFVFKLAGCILWAVLVGIVAVGLIIISVLFIF